MCPTNDPRHEDCPECGECRMSDVKHYAKIPRLDEEGKQMYEPVSGVAMHIAMPMHSHVVAHSAFNASGLVSPNPLCTHGRPCPPDVDPGLPGMLVSRLTEEQRSRMMVVRSKYLDADGRCPVCKGEPRPEDLTTRLDAVPA